MWPIDFQYLHVFKCCEMRNKWCEVISLPYCDTWISASLYILIKMILNVSVHHKICSFCWQGWVISSTHNNVCSSLKSYNQSLHPVFTFLHRVHEKNCWLLGDGAKRFSLFVSEFSSSSCPFVCLFVRLYALSWLNFYRPRSEGDNVLGSVRPSVRPSVCPSVSALTLEKNGRRVIISPRYLSVCRLSRADAVDRLLIFGRSVFITVFLYAEPFKV